MKVLLLSDLHLEVNGRYEGNGERADLVVLAGDIHNGVKGIEWAKRQFADRPVVYVMGNHEYYHHSIDALLTQARSVARHSNVTLLEKEAFDFEGWTILGTTLWSDFMLHGSAYERESHEIATRRMMDYHVIEGATVDTTRNRCAASLHWLERELKYTRHMGRPTIVVTHHAPSRRSIPTRYAHDILNAAFASDLEDLINDTQPGYWFHGHTHLAVDYSVGKTRVISNPLGYSRESTGFNDDILEL